MTTVTLRGKTAIVGIGEVPTLRTYPGRTTNSLLTEAARMAIADAGLHKEDIDGIITRGSDVNPMDLAEYMGIHPGFCEGVTISITHVLIFISVFERGYSFVKFQQK
ncbi:MAG: hypothetical protein IIC53_05105 [Proteobacteria bacterium]|nr:hypothetical protein [Pseudomonadota bacterium]